MLVPLKTRDPKSRLAGALSADERAELMRTLLERVVGAVREAGVERVTVVCAEPIDGYERMARRRPRLERRARSGDGRARPRAARRGRLRRPAASCAARRSKSCSTATPERGIAIARALDGGTNAVAMRPPGLVLTRFGEPGAPPSTPRSACPHVDGRPAGPRVRRRHARRPRQDAGRMALKLGYKAIGGAVPPAAAARPVHGGGAARARAASGSPTTSSRSATTAVTPRRACPGWARSASAPSGHCSGRACSPRRCATTRRSSPRRSRRSRASTPGGSGWASAPASP